MVKFSRELEAKLVPEWKDAFVNYRRLKKHVKKIKLSFLRSDFLPSSSATALDGGDGDGGFGFSLLDPIRSLSTVLFSDGRRDPSPPIEEQNILELTLVQSREDAVEEFMAMLEEELEKVNDFYTDKEKEFSELFPILNKQLQILLDLKHLLHEHYDRRHRGRQGSVPSTPQSPDDGSTNAILISGGSLEGEPETPGATVREEESLTEGVIAAMERNGVRFVGYYAAAAKKKLAKTGTGRLRAAASLRIEIPATTPARAISMMWEDLVNSVRKEEGSGGGGGGGDYVNRRKLQRAEKMIRDAFLQLFSGLDLLNTYR